MAKSKKLSRFARFSKQQIIIALVFILGFGGFGVYKLAFSSAATHRTLSLFWIGNEINNGREPFIKYSKHVTSNGWVCAVTNFKVTGTKPRTAYVIHVEELQFDGRWKYINSSPLFRADGTRDHVCFAKNIHRGNNYRIKFVPNSQTDMRGVYEVWGFERR